jgi:ribosome-associated protein
MLVINRTLRIPSHELRWSFARSSGPGGQNVNKVNSKAILHWNAVGSPSRPPDVRDRLLRRYANRITVQGDLVLASQRFRDAGRNVADCLERLRTILADVAQTPKSRRATRPTRGSVRRRLTTKRLASQKKQSRRPASAE